MIFFRKRNNEEKLLIDGKQFKKYLYKGIRSAKESIYFRVYMWKDDYEGRAVLKQLEKKIKKTPNIKIIIEKDAFGTRVYNWERLLTLGKSSGDIFSNNCGMSFLKKYAKNVEFDYVGSYSVLFFKFLKENDHSKVFIFDENLADSSAIIGGMNIADEYLINPNHKEPDIGGWHDYMVRLEGESVKYLLSRKRDKNKAWISKKVLHSMDLVFNWKGRRNIKEEIIKEIKKAQEQIIVQHAYITDDAVIRNLKKKAKNGVEVIVIMPDRSDGAYHANMHTIKRFLRLTKNNENRYPLKVYLYRGMIHAKAILIDEKTAILGSANLTMNSFKQMNETNAIFRKGKVVKNLNKQLNKDLKYCDRVYYSTVPVYNRWFAIIQSWFV